MNLNPLCPFEDCKHYKIKTTYDRICYYEPQCWRGFLRCIVEMFKIKKHTKG